MYTIEFITTFKWSMQSNVLTLLEATSEEMRLAWYTSLVRYKGIVDGEFVPEEATGQSNSEAKPIPTPQYQHNEPQSEYITRSEMISMFNELMGEIRSLRNELKAYTDNRTREEVRMELLQCIVFIDFIIIYGIFVLSICFFCFSWI